MDAIRLLKNDHVEMRDLLGQLESTTPRGAQKRKKLLTEIQKNIQHRTLSMQGRKRSHKAMPVWQRRGLNPTGFSHSIGGVSL